MTTTAKKRKRRDPRIGGPGLCGICKTYTGKKLTVSKFFRCGPVPSWAVVHVNCNRLENRKKFIARMERLRQAVARTETHADERGGIGTAVGPDCGSGPQTGQEGAGVAGGV